MTNPTSQDGMSVEEVRNWGIKEGYRPQPVEITRETAQMFFYIDHTWSKRETRAHRDGFSVWGLTKDEAHKLAERLTSADAEYKRRELAARAWLAKERESLIAAALRSRASSALSREVGKGVGRG